MDVLSAASSVAGRPMTAEPTDELLLRRAQRGDQAARAALIDLYQRPVHSLVSRMLVGRRAQIDDVVQDSLLKMLEALPRFDPRGSAKLSTWILTIATRTAIDALRKDKRSFEVIDEEKPSSVSLEARTIAKEAMSKVEAAMATLPDDHRAVLVLRAYHDLDYREIASILSIEEGTVKSRLARARAALRTAL
jgi:RNA polymerase sigma-70 factor (ECF subfamily)